jgi:hypothetical protein
MTWLRLYVEEQVEDVFEIQKLRTWVTILVGRGYEQLLV